MKKEHISGHSPYVDSFQRILIPILFVIIALLIGTLGYEIVERMSFIDALYLTLTTISTTSSHANFKPLSTQGIIFSIFFIALSVFTVVYAVGAIVEFIVEGNIIGLRRRKKMEKRLEEIKDHYIISGFGRVGHQIAMQFEAEGIPYVVIDMKPETAIELEQKGIPFIIGNVSSDEVLEKAGISRAKGIFAAADSDTENVYVTLTAKVLNPKLFVVARASHKEIENKLRKAGADRVISPYFIAGSRMASMAVRPVSIEFLDIVTAHDNIELGLKETKVSEKSHVVGKTLKDIQLKTNTGAMVLSIKKKDGTFDLSPSADSKIDSDDILVALGTESQLESLDKFIQK